MEGAVFSVGNPLLDISATVPKEFFDKYELKTANAILAEEKHLPIYSELVDNHEVEYSAGGAAQNTVRALTWMLKHNNVATYVGCVGDDEYGQQLERVARKDGVNVQYLKDPSVATGTCAALILNHERSLVANLGAANNYQSHHFESEAIQTAVNRARFFYAAGYFITVSVETLVSIGQTAAETNKPFIFNLAAPFVIDFFSEKLDQVLPYTDVVMANEFEGEAFGKKYFGITDLKQVAQKLAGLKKVNDKRKRIVIFTQGPQPTIVATEDEITEYPVIEIADHEIVDSNGAGDCFAGGFLAGFIQDKDMAQCIAAGNYCANYILKTGGIKFNTEATFNFE